MTPRFLIQKRKHLKTFLWFAYKLDSQMQNGMAEYTLLERFQDFRAAYKAARKEANVGEPIRVVFRDKTIYDVETDGDLMLVLMKVL